MACALMLMEAQAPTRRVCMGCITVYFHALRPVGLFWSPSNSRICWLLPHEAAPVRFAVMPQLAMYSLR